ncbi:MAG: hypothetical protein H6582_08830 [Crocinitomicaceae bacterium]|nr:hypothetical protein [Crocinitomicaceae bacterium]
MKIYALILVATISFASLSQNTFPTNGNVGINTTNPSAKLDVNGNMKVDSTLIVKDSVIIEKDLRTKGKFVVEDQAYFLEKVYMYDKLILSSTLEAGENINIDNNLNVSNNAQISNKLDVVGNSTFSGNVKVNNIPTVNNLNNPNLEFVFRAPNGNLETYDIAGVVGLFGNQLYSIACPFNGGDIPNPMWSNGLNKIFVTCPQVNVGINTANPEYKLHVVGTTYSFRLKIGYKDATSTNSYIEGFVPNNQNNIISLGKESNSINQKIYFQILNNGTIITNNESGHILVSYNSNGEKVLQLEDNGLLRAREIKVDLVAWPDYVFDEGYKLMSINELALYIDKHHHLPGLPIAKELEEEGLSLGSIVKIQMEKIEEQTLYTIQLNNEVETLKAENVELKNEIQLIKQEIEELKELIKG